MLCTSLHANPDPEADPGRGPRKKKNVIKSLHGEYLILLLFLVTSRSNNFEKIPLSLNFKQICSLGFQHFYGKFSAIFASWIWIRFLHADPDPGGLPL